jgi:hypothetical protein
LVKLFDQERTRCKPDEALEAESFEEGLLRNNEIFAEGFKHFRKVLGAGTGDLEE